MTDKMREEFEAWANGDVDLDISKMSDGGYYRNIQTIIAWDAWRSSRAALCVELPKSHNLEISNDFDYGFKQSIIWCKDSLDAAGVRHK